jgi:hypothetical protein
MKTVWIGAFAVTLLGSAAGWALPAAPPGPGPAVAGPSQPLLLIRHHHRHGHGHWRSRWSDEREPEAIDPGTMIGPSPGRGISGSEQPAVSAAPPPAVAPPAAAPNRARRGSGSAPAIRWVDPEKSPR